ncbi:hypothetical protein TSAR_012628 [Trichomalopsis sarcophagae]|uniref:Bromodomain associated domain-containing protein n=1 Tax=Trichomalopsis sarcophagae TaxID=543379 RepID=A0A232F4K1_9HYME|nr:hypothetical protein TSAR_012628 [Trichomalopsis sarcophagae]
MKSSKTSTTGGLWGELPVRETHKQEVITPDIIENVWRQVMDEANNSDCDYQMHRQPEYIQMPLGNPHVLNTVNLRQQLRSMDEGNILRNVTVIEDESQDEIPRDSYYFTIPTKQNKKKFKNHVNITHLKPSTAQGLLKHAVTVLLAHIGFDEASDYAIATLTDAADHFLKRIGLLLKVASEERNYGFPDAMEKVLVEANVGGIIGLHNYYEEYILRHEKNVKRKVENKVEQQRQLELNICNAKMELDEATSNLQFDGLEEFGNVYREVPTLQLLDPEMGFPPSLDAGFQMLHSLEQDELNSLEVDEEDVTVSDSPSTGHQRADFMKK